MFGIDESRVSMLGDDAMLRSFYREISGGAAVTAVPRRVVVDDIEATLSRVWDFGGTILSVSFADHLQASVASATFTDPRGHIVSLVRAPHG